MLFITISKVYSLQFKWQMLRTWIAWDNSLRFLCIFHQGAGVGSHEFLYGNLKIYLSMSYSPLFTYNNRLLPFVPTIQSTGMIAIGNFPSLPFPYSHTANTFREILGFSTTATLTSDSPYFCSKCQEVSKHMCQGLTTSHFSCPH